MAAPIEIMNRRIPHMNSGMQLVLTTLICLTAIAWMPCQLAAQVVQLPAYRQTGFTGTVSVPDQGTVGLGGSRYSATGRTGRGWGPYAGTAIGRQSASSSIALSAEIIDLQAMDEAILGTNATGSPTVRVGSGKMGPRGTPMDPADRTYLSGLRAGQYSGRRAEPIDSNRWRLALAGAASDQTGPENESQVEADIRYYLAQGKEAEKQNRLLSARVFYRMAVERMTPEMVQRYRKILADRKAAEEAEKERLTPDRIRF